MAKAGYTNMNIRFSEVTARRLKAIAAERLVNPSIIADKAVAQFLAAMPDLPATETRVVDGDAPAEP